MARVQVTDQIPGHFWGGVVIAMHVTARISSARLLISVSRPQAANWALVCLD